MNPNNPAARPDFDLVRVSITEQAKNLTIAWRKYTEGFGEPPHGTERQLAALLELMPDKERIAALESENAQLCTTVVNLEIERSKLWNERDTAYHAWQPVTAWDELRKERDQLRAQLVETQKERDELKYEPDGQVRANLSNDAVQSILDKAKEYMKERDRLRDLLRRALPFTAQPALKGELHAQILDALDGEKT